MARVKVVRTRRAGIVPGNGGMMSRPPSGTRPLRSASSKTVGRRQTPYWQEMGWTKDSSGALGGLYRTRFGDWKGSIEPTWRGGHKYFIFDPPSEMKSHSHWICCHHKGNGRFHVHMVGKTRDVSSGIFEIQSIIDESFGKCGVTPKVMRQQTSSAGKTSMIPLELLTFKQQLGYLGALKGKPALWLASFEATEEPLQVLPLRTSRVPQLLDPDLLKPRYEPILAKLQETPNPYFRRDENVPLQLEAPTTSELLNMPGKKRDEEDAGSALWKRLFRWKPASDKF